MCLQALREGDAAERPVGALLRAQLNDAVLNGMLAAAMVLLVMLSWGAPTASVVVRTVGALLLGVTLYLSVLLVGTIAIKLRRTLTLERPRST